MKQIIWLPILLFNLLVFNIASAEPPAGKGPNKNQSKHNINSNRQSDPDSLRAQERAEERSALKKGNKPKKQKKHLNQYERDDSEYSKYSKKSSKRQITSEQILENEINNAHRNVVESIAEKTKPTKAWWKFWGSEE